MNKVNQDLLNEYNCGPIAQHLMDSLKLEGLYMKIRRTAVNTEFTTALRRIHRACHAENVCVTDRGRTFTHEEYRSDIRIHNESESVSIMFKDKDLVDIETFHTDDLGRIHMVERGLCRDYCTYLRDTVVRVDTAYKNRYTTRELTWDGTFLMKELVRVEGHCQTRHTYTLHTDGEVGSILIDVETAEMEGKDVITSSNSVIEIMTSKTTIGE